MRKKRRRRREEEEEENKKRKGEDEEEEHDIDEAEELESRASDVIIVKQEVVVEDHTIEIRLPNIDTDFIPYGYEDQFLGVIFNTIPEIPRTCYVCRTTVHTTSNCPLKFQMLRYAEACADGITVIRKSVEKCIYKLK